MKKAPLIVITGCFLVISIFFLGPKVTFTPLEDPGVALWDISLDSLDLYVHLKGAEVPGLKPDNESRIIWADSIRKTHYSLVYLHGFSASPLESHPLPFEVARRYGMNLYLPLLAGHGQDNKDSFKELQPNDLVKDAKEALAIGQLLGEDVIVISCSTGSTLAIYLAGANKELVDALIMYSPNIALYNRMAKLMTGPWGRQILLGVAGEYRLPDSTTTAAGHQYWTTTYHNEGLIALQSLLDQTMKQEVFEKVEQPYFIGYYYKNEKEQDKTISVEAIRRFDEQTGTPDRLKRLVAFPDAGEHVIANPIKSKSVAAVRDSTFQFMEAVLSLSPLEELRE